MTDILDSLITAWDDTVDYRRNPTKWVEEKTQEYLWELQREIMLSVKDNRYTAVPSCHDAGKSFIASRVVAWWIDVHPPGEAFVVTTAPTAAQVSAILWREIGKAHRKADLIGRILSSPIPSWKIGDELVGYGRKPADYEESAFQGIHNRYVLVVIDEACGVDEHLFNSVDALVTNEHARVLAIGNPDNNASHFAKIAKPGSDWHVIPIDGLRTPNMTYEHVVGSDPENPLYPLTAALMRAEKIPWNTEAVPNSLREMLISPLWVEERIRRWCGLSDTAHLEYDPTSLADLLRRRTVGSALFTAKVRGVFPTQSSDGVIPLGWIEQAMARWRDWRDDGKKGTGLAAGDLVLGADIARQGEDETVVAVRRGSIVQELHRYRINDIVETTEEISAFCNEPRSKVVVDVIGIGAGVYDLLRRWKNESKIVAAPIPFNAAAGTVRMDRIGQFRFHNDRAAAWWNLREMLNPANGHNIALPDDERLKEELVVVQYKHLGGGIIKIESKDDIRKRMGRSTDSADAVIQSFWVHSGFIVAPDSTTWRDAKVGDGVVRYAGHSGFSSDEMFGSADSESFQDLVGNTNDGWGF